MPELPEVETVRRSLADVLPGRRVTAVDLRHPGVIHYPEPETFVRELPGHTFGAVGRRGKYLLLELTPGPLTLIVHLRMTGQLLYVPAATAPEKHTHAVIALDTDYALHYKDMRRFGGFCLSGPDRDGWPAGLRTLGPEPDDPAFTPAALAKALHGRTAPIKALLLDQRIVAGLGNIYADESLFRAGIRPDRAGGSLTEAEIERLHEAIGDVIEHALSLGGTSFYSYIDAAGKRGEFLEYLNVYGRTGQPCPGCGEPVQRQVTAGRGTHYCGRCQQ